MAKKKREGYKPSKHTKERRQYIDYDYIHKLNDEEKEWLSRFTDEEYGSSFELNLIFIEYTDLNCEFREKVKGNIVYEDKYIQVNKNTEINQKNLDMRKMRPYKQYYRKSNGKFTTDKKYRYSNKNINNPNDRKRFNSKVKDMRNDLFNVGLKDSVNTQPESFNNTSNNKKVVQHYTLEDYDYTLSCEDMMILQEEININDDLANQGLIEDQRVEPKKKKSK